MRNWLHYCEFSVRETKKGIYYDGHEREDVVKVLYFNIIRDRSRIILAFFTQDRLERFIPELLETLENAVKVEKDSEGNVFVTDLDAKYLIVNQDEKSHHSNDVQK